jgi:hypothetical protein
LDEEIVDEDVDEEIVDEDAIETENSELVDESQEELDENDENDEKEELVEEEEEELIEIEIDGVTYCTENEENGFIYVIDEDGTVGEATGYLKDGEPFFN